MFKPIKLEVIHVSRHEEHGVRTFILLDGNMPKAVEGPARYEKVTLDVPNTGVGYCIGGMLGDVLTTSGLTLRIQHPEMFGQFKVGATVVLTVED